MDFDFKKQLEIFFLSSGNQAETLFHEDFFNIMIQHQDIQCRSFYSVKLGKIDNCFPECPNPNYCECLPGPRIFEIVPKKPSWLQTLSSRIKSTASISFEETTSFITMTLLRENNIETHMYSCAIANVRALRCNEHRKCCRVPRYLRATLDDFVVEVQKPMGFSI